MNFLKYSCRNGNDTYLIQSCVCVKSTLKKILLKYIVQTSERHRKNNFDHRKIKTKYFKVE